jgi:WS/DGAT/MGAT family acyltransferase
VKSPQERAEIGTGINMKQMNMVDAFFLHSDQPRTAQNVTIIWVYDRSTSRGSPVTFEEVRDHIASRVHLIPAFRKRVVHVPGDIDFPWWVDDPNFAPVNHIHHNTLPPPGDWRQLRELAAKIHARCVDLSRPLWDIHMVDGVDNVDGVPSGAFALIMKCQHAAMDGPTSVKANETINSTSRRRRIPPVPEYPGPEPQPARWELFSQGVRHGISEPVRSVWALGKLAPIMADKIIGDRILDTGSPDLKLPAVPHTRFNGRVSSKRVLDACFMDLETVKALRRATAGATLNDIAVTVFGGALRKYLSGHDELPEAPLRGLMPMALPQTDETGELGNELTFTFVNLATDIADPLERLNVIMASTRAAKANMSKRGFEITKNIFEMMPGMLIGPTVRLSSMINNEELGAFVNVAVSNVAGPPKPVYLAGCKMVRMASAAPAPDGMGLVNYMTSYAGFANFGYSACQEMIPDPDHYTECIRESFQELCVRSGVQ